MQEKKKMRNWISIILLGISPMTAFSETESDYPSRAISIVVPFTAGGSSDALSRLIAKKMNEDLGQPVVVENRPGGNTILGSELAAKAPADGYTLYSTNTTIVQIPMLYDARYDEARDFVPVVQYATAPLVLAVLSSNPAHSAKELFNWVKERPGKTSYGTGGAGSTSHISAEALKRSYEMDWMHVPYKGESAMLLDFLGGRVDVYNGTPLALLPHVRSGKARFIGVTGESRVPTLPDVPTFKEQGIPELNIVGWYGMFAPAKTPKPIIAKLSKKLSEIIQSPEVSSFIRDNGFIVTGLGSEEFEKELPYFRKTFQRMIKENNINVQ